MNTGVYEVLEQHSSVTWICCQCGLPNFTSSLFTSGSIDIDNSFSSLESVDLDNQPLTSPLATSSPQMRLPSSQNVNQTQGDKNYEKGLTQKRTTTGKEQGNQNTVKNPDNKLTQKKETSGNHTSKPVYKPLKIMVVNFQSIRGKCAELATSLEFDNPDVLIGTETWLGSEVNSSELFPNTYNVFRKDRPLDNKGRAYGGVLIAAKNNFICVQRQDLDSNCELLWVEIKITGAKPVLVGSFYCTPNEKIEYLSYLRESLTKIDMNQYSNIWLAGDFTLGDIDWSTQSVRPGGKKPTMCRELIDIANDYGLEQIVDKPTRKDRTLDLFFIRNSSLVIKSTVLPGISDHDGIPLILLNTKPSKNKQKPRKVFMYQKANVTELKADVQQISNDFSEKDVSNSKCK